MIQTIIRNTDTRHTAVSAALRYRSRPESFLSEQNPRILSTVSFPYRHIADFQ